jgi:hypothetical protein
MFEQGNRINESNAPLVWPLEFVALAPEMAIAPAPP